MKWIGRLGLRSTTKAVRPGLPSTVRMPIALGRIPCLEAEELGEAVWGGFNGPEHSQEISAPNLADIVF
jgi:hypothetical protein